MLHELLAYFAGSLMLFALSSKGWFTVIGITSILTGFLVWWGCGVFGTLWYTPFTRRPIHWLWSGLASVASVLFVWLFAASAYVPQISAVSALVWRAELTFDPQWKDENFENLYKAVKEAGYEDFTNYPVDKGVIPLNHPESIRISSRVTAGDAHRHFRTERPLLSQAYWSSPAEAAKKIEQRNLRHFQGETDQSAGDYSAEILLDIAKDVPVWSNFIAEIDRVLAGGGVLAWLLEGAGIKRGVGLNLSRVDDTLKSIEKEQAEKGQSTSLLAMDYAILANEILIEAREKGGRVRRLVILCLVGLWILALGIPLGLIGMAARREADLSRHQPAIY
jgi:hypothetical protein